MKTPNVLLDRIKDKDLTNLSLNLYEYLLRISDNKVLNIDRGYDFDSYKEMVRLDLVLYKKIYDSLKGLNNDEVQKVLKNRNITYNYVNEILSNEDMLDNYTVFKIQQFINDVISNIGNQTTYKEQKYLVGNHNVSSLSKSKKYITYKNSLIDISDCIGFLYHERVATSIYRQFGLKKMDLKEFEGALDLKSLENILNNKDYLEEINRLLFKAGVDCQNNNLVYIHPVSDDKTVIKFIREGEVAKRVYYKNLKLN